MKVNHFIWTWTDFFPLPLSLEANIQPETQVHYHFSWFSQQPHKMAYLPHFYRITSSRPYVYAEEFSQDQSEPNPTNNFNEVRRGARTPDDNVAC